MYKIFKSKVYHTLAFDPIERYKALTLLQPPILETFFVALIGIIASPRILRSPT
jgi:hypothetical protein